MSMGCPLGKKWFELRGLNLLRGLEFVEYENEEGGVIGGVYS